MKHLMIDLETWALQPDAALRSIGAIYFSLDAMLLGDTFYFNISDDSTDAMGFYKDPDTEQWWSEQSEEARKVFSENPKHIVAVLDRFNDWIREDAADTCVWSHGASFDITLLTESLRICGFGKPLWNHRNIRDTRTLIGIGEALTGGEIPWDEFVGTKHNALDDAVHQAKHMLKIMQILRGNYNAGKIEGDTARPAHGNVGPGQAAGA